MAKDFATVLGIGLILVGVFGFVIPDPLGMHLSALHSVVHIATGLVALWLGFWGSASAAKTFCIGFGAVYVLLGIAGFALGVAGAPSAGVPGPHDAHMLKLLPGMLELGAADHVIHVLLGALFLAGGVTTKSAPAAAPRTA